MATSELWLFFFVAALHSASLVNHENLWPTNRCLSLYQHGPPLMSADSAEDAQSPPADTSRRVGRDRVI